jgi:hypothetical protein
MVPYIYEGALRPLPDMRQQSDWYWAEAVKENSSNKTPMRALTADVRFIVICEVGITSVLSCLFFILEKLRNDARW